MGYAERGLREESRPAALLRLLRERGGLPASRRRGLNAAGPGRAVNVIGEWNTGWRGRLERVRLEERGLRSSRISSAQDLSLKSFCFQQAIITDISVRQVASRRERYNYESSSI